MPVIEDLRGKAVVWATAATKHQFELEHARRKDQWHKGKPVSYVHMTPDALTLIRAEAFEAGAKLANTTGD